jgi:hypothetical protein
MPTFKSYEEDPILKQRGEPTTLGDGVHAKPPIEGAARAGYLDALRGKPFSADWETAEKQWQRNYESGRLWGVAILTLGIEAPVWKPGELTPALLLEALQTIRAETGSGTRPEDFSREQRVMDDGRRLRAIVPQLRRGRVVDRMTE